MERDQKKLKPTLLGRAVDGLMLEQFPHIVDVDFSAEMEKNLDKIESGKADWHKTVDDFYQGFAAASSRPKKEHGRQEGQGAGRAVQRGLRPLRPSHGHQGGQVRQVPGVQRLPESAGAPSVSVKDTGGVCPKCGKGRMLERKSAKGRIYYGCERYPDCDFMTWDTPVPTKCEKVRLHPGSARAPSSTAQKKAAALRCRCRRRIKGKKPNERI